MKTDEIIVDLVLSGLNEHTETPTQHEIDEMIRQRIADKLRQCTESERAGFDRIFHMGLERIKDLPSCLALMNRTIEKRKPAER